MTLREFLDKYNVTLNEFSVETGVSASTLSRYAAGIRVPKPRVMERIVTATGGMVQPNDFYDAVARRSREKAA